MLCILMSIVSQNMSNKFKSVVLFLKIIVCYLHEKNQIDLILFFELKDQEIFIFFCGPLKEGGDKT